MAAQGKRKRSALVAAREVETDAAVRRLEPVRAWVAQNIADEKTVATKTLSGFLSQLITFGAETLGPNSSGAEKWSVKIPMRILLDWKAGGGLCEVLRAAFEFKNKEGWRQFHLTTPGKRDKNLEMYSYIFHHLISPRIYFGGEIDASNSVRLGKLVKQVGGTVVLNEKEATHVIVQKADEETDFTEDEFVRTIEHRENKVLVHWWYYPDSYDEWLPQTEIQGQEDPPAKHEGAWYLTSRFITDSAKFNEWMNELDYEPEERDDAPAKSGGRGGGRRGSARGTAGAKSAAAAAAAEADTHALRPRRSAEAEHKEDDRSKRRRESRAKRGRGSDDDEDDDEDDEDVASAEAKRKRRPSTPVQQRAAESASTPAPATPAAAAAPRTPAPTPATPAAAATPAPTPAHAPMEVSASPAPSPQTPAAAPAVAAATPVAAPAAAHASTPAPSYQASPYGGVAQSPMMQALPAGRPVGVSAHGPEARRNNTAPRHRDPYHRGLAVPGQAPTLFNISQNTQHQQQAPQQLPVAEETPPPYPPPQASWFKIDEIHPIEQKSLPEFFTGKAGASKTPALYKEYRDFMIHTYEQNPKQYLTQVACRRNLSGDVCGILRVHSMLEHWGLINCNVHPDTFPVTVPVPSTTNLQAVQAAMVQPTPPLPPPPANLISRREVIPLSKAAQIVCTACSQACPKLRYVAGASPYSGVQQAGKLELCANCYAEGKYPTFLSSNDFVKIDLGDDAVLMEEAAGEEPWTEAETLKLLDAIDTIGENWDEVAKAVGRTKEACLLHFVRLPIEDSYLDAPLPAPRGVAQTTDASMPFSNAANPVMAVVSFLASAVAPAVAAASAQAALSALLKEKPKHEGEANGKADDADKKESDEFGTPENTRVAAAAALGAAAVKARVMAEKEDRVVQRLVTQAVEVQLKKLELKLKHFDEMDDLLDREHAQVEHARQALYNERLSLMQQAKASSSSTAAAAAATTPSSAADGHATPAPAAAASAAPAAVPAPTPMQVDGVGHK